MRLHYLLFVCVATYSGGDFFTPIQANLPNTTGRLLNYALITDSSDEIATHSFSMGCDSHTAETSNHAISPWPTLPLVQAHAHNDYEHKRPLFDALSQGFSQIEVDVHLLGGELYVSHLTPLFLSEEKSLRKLYLDPLKQIIECNGGCVFPLNDMPLRLMVDIKTDASETYDALKSYLQPYRHMLSSFDNGVKTERAVTVFLSGNRPVKQVLAEKTTFMALDGRIEDLGTGMPPDLMPLVSERFSEIFGWEMLGQQRTDYQWLVLQRLARLTHSEGKKLRLWESPEEEVVWEKMLAAGCDIINTNELARLRHFLHHRNNVILATH